MSAWTRAGGHYEIVLALVIAALALTPLDTGTSRPLTVALLGGVFVFSFWTSGASRRALLIACGLVLAALIADAAGQIAGGRAARIMFTAAGAALSAGAITTIFGQLAAQSRITRRTVTGALSVYLLIGLLFTYVFAFIGVVNSDGFFAQSGEHDASDYVYFSYVTLTTVGYGDLTAGTNVGRLLAAFEALVGQLYLVTIVAVVIGNIGRERSTPPGGPPGRRGRPHRSAADRSAPDRSDPDRRSPGGDVPGAAEPRTARDE